MRVECRRAESFQGRLRILRDAPSSSRNGRGVREQGSRHVVKRRRDWRCYDTPFCWIRIRNHQKAENSTPEATYSYFSSRLGANSYLCSQLVD